MGNNRRKAHNYSVSKLLLISFAVFFLLVGLLLLVAHESFIEQASTALVGYQARHPDVVDAGRAARLTHGSIVIGIVGTGLFLLLCLNDRFRETVTPMLFPGAIGLFLTLLAAVHVYVLPDSGFLRFLYQEDSFLETLTAVAFLVSALFFAWSAWMGRKLIMRKSGVGSVWVFWICVLALLGAFVLGMEEISWGQRIFRWETPALLADANVQQETNLHNLFNSVFGSVYRLLIVIPVAVSASLGLCALKQPRFPIFCILPRSDLLGLSLLIGILAVLMPYPPTELLEELVAVFVFFYSIQCVRCLRRREQSL